jgi:protoporphyrin/coproporphyrin ferrochelatase
MPENIDSIFFVSFGGPEGPDDVIPFLENVLRGKPVPRERLLEVAEHYQSFGGISPINRQNREIISRLQLALGQAGLNLPIFWGNRNWKPTIEEGLTQLQSAGFSRALPIFTNMFSSYSGCRQYRENLTEALQTLNAPSDLLVPRLRFGFNHPLFVEAQAELISQGLEKLNAIDQHSTRILFTAHSIPLAMADNCRYVAQLTEAAKLIVATVTKDVTTPLAWELVYQSRSGPPQQPWLVPDICDRMGELKQQEIEQVLVVPLGFVSDHIEVLYDLDTEAQASCNQLGINYVRVPAVSSHPKFIGMLVDLIQERLNGETQRKAIGDMPPLHDVCPQDCCLYPRTRPTAP